MTVHSARIVLALLTGLLVAVQPGAADAASGSPPKSLADFTLNDRAGARRSLAEWNDKPVVAIVFLGTECPLAKLYGSRLAELDKKYRDQGVQIIGINANQQDTLQELASYATKFGIEFPLLKDPGGKVADLFGATRTPEAFVLDQQRVIRYQGRIDDQYGVGAARKRATKHELADAIEALLAGQPVAVESTPAVGCLIGRREPSRTGGEINYSQHIAPIVQQRCVTCHREGQIAPFAMTSYEDVAAWSDMCLEVIEQNRMPPWSANPQYGEFHNDARMSDDEKGLFRQWVEAGAPEGDPGDLPPPRQFHEGWQIDRPDLVIRMPEEFAVAATGTVPYQYFYVDPGFTEDVWVRGAEARPGNPEVVHHVILFYLPPGQEEPEDRDPLYNAVAAFAPGMPPIVGPDEYAVRIPAGSKLVFQMHYTPTGTAQTDRSEAALIFADPRKVAKEVRIMAGINVKFLIPPHARDYVVRAKRTVPRDMMLHTLTPHMHYRGKSFRFTATYPDGGEEILLDVPRYDFNWQIVYQLKQPKRLPQGTVVRLEAHYDNSADNPLNPDPNQVVYWGDQTWEEMMLGSMSVSDAGQDLRVGPPRVEPLRPASGDDPGEYRVTFQYRPAPDDQAVPESLDAVCVAGAFNDWSASDTKLAGPDAEGCYTTQITLPVGRYEYKFVLNGDVWKSDPGVREAPLKNGNNVLTVE